MSKLETPLHSDRWWKKALFLSLVILTVYSIVGLVGFVLWFVFPVQKIHGLTYLQATHLILYYIIINIMDIFGMLLFSQILYYRRLKTLSPIRDGFVLGSYSVIFSWLIDIVIYVFVRKTLPTIRQYFLGKNQPEIGIAWLVGFLSAVLAGCIEAWRRALPSRQHQIRSNIATILLVAISIVLTVFGILFFDIRP